MLVPIEIVHAESNSQPSWNDYIIMKDPQANNQFLTLNSEFIEDLYAEYLKNPGDFSADWKSFFSQLPKACATHSPAPSSAKAPSLALPTSDKQVAVLQLINAYRVRGHEQADIDPLKLSNWQPVAELSLAYHRLTEADLATSFNTGSLVGPGRATLGEILAILTTTYCGHMGAEYMHIADTAQKRWIQEHLERQQSSQQIPTETRRRILQRIIAAEGLERYMHTKYVGQKRFSLEGGESLVPLLDGLVQRAGTTGVKEIVIGMAHRGRLNVLVNIFGKMPRLLFQEFEGKFGPSTNQGSGDVKYHQGFSSDVETPGGSVHLALAFNPSHLEIVDPVVQGSVRARQQRHRDTEGKKVLALLIHGDAAFAGQGVVMETFNMSQARGFTTGGTIHIIINNQIGFTTSNPLDSRSTQYCTEVARMVQAPIFHVNGDDPEAVVLAMQVALDFRMTFKKDVVIDLVCYRRHGHSEADEPSVTQPLMYQKIRNTPTITTVYADRLVKDGVVTTPDIEEMTRSFREAIAKGETVAPHILTQVNNPFTVDWSPYKGATWTNTVDTGIAADTIKDLGDRLLDIPVNFVLHDRVAKILADRRQMADGTLPLDWGFAETMAYASLLHEGYAVRLSGQDSGRGTFFHRHSVLYDQKNGDCYVPLQNLSSKQPNFLVIDSLLSEEAVLGFEYGFSASEPRSLVIWEAQFGDFANNAQVVIDQFISSGEAKWGRLCGLVLFLPHGYDGQGPEHSSARLERFLQICAENNMQVCVPSQPAQMFHMLRRQMLRPLRKPLIVMTPKSLLRHRESVSTLSDLADKGFKLVMGETDTLPADKITRVVFCSGKVYFDLAQERRTRELTHVAIIRVEQLYPFPATEVAEQLKRYPSVKQLVWCQEEPRNQGAWDYIRGHLSACLQAKQKLSFAGRPASPSPAVGYLAKHNEQQRALVEEALSS